MLVALLLGCPKPETTDDTDTVDTDPVIDDACAPPDAFWGGVPADLATATPYDASYDAGLSAVVPKLITQPGEVSYADPFVITSATVVGWGDLVGNETASRIFLADGAVTLPLLEDGHGPEPVAIGTKVSFTTQWVGYYSGEQLLLHATGWTLDSDGNPVYVRELGAANVHFATDHNQLTHAWGHVTASSAADCGPDGMTCYTFTHDGTTDLFRVRNDNPHGLTPGFAGDLCVELVAPVGYHDPSADDHTEGTSYLDVLPFDWMRVWSP
jgi:hypothetical protein